MNPPQVQVKREWTFEDFVWQRYVPDRSELRGWRRSTREKFDFLMQRMGAAFGKQLLTSITTTQMQKLLADLAKRECADTVKGVRSYLRAIFKEAHEEKIVDYNAARSL
jgi:hypothetical protein